MTEAKDLEKQERNGRKSDPCIMVIFGAAGDLTKRKLLPALYNLAKQHFLPEEFALVGLGRIEREILSGDDLVGIDVVAHDVGLAGDDGFHGENDRARCRR